MAFSKEESFPQKAVPSILRDVVWFTITLEAIKTFTWDKFGRIDTLPLLWKLDTLSIKVAGTFADVPTDVVIVRIFRSLTLKFFYIKIYSKGPIKISAWESPTSHKVTIYATL